MSRLDRLSALIDGLSPTLRLSHVGPSCAPYEHLPCVEPAICLHLLVEGRLRVDAGGGGRELGAPAVAVLRAAQGHALTPLSGRVALIRAEVRFDGPASALLLDAFTEPALLGLKDAAEDLQHLLGLIRTELAQPRCGQGALLARAGEILLITVLRHIIAQPGRGVGILAALADSRIAHAVVAMHERPEAPWSLESLAERARMSRTAFAVGFRERMGATPGAYLAGLRLSIADQALRSGQGLKRAARAAGYASPSALSRALSRRRGAALTSPP